jgi:putative sigma-54 modulation protein
MNLQISGQNIELTQALKDHINKKSQKLTHHFANIISLTVVLSVEKEQQIAEATVAVNNFEAHASVAANDMYIAIDDLLAKLEKQLLKHKEKHKN